MARNENVDGPTCFAARLLDGSLTAGAAVAVVDVWLLLLLLLLYDVLIVQMVVVVAVRKFLHGQRPLKQRVVADVVERGGFLVVALLIGRRRPKTSKLAVSIQFARWGGRGDAIDGPQRVQIDILRISKLAAVVGQ